MLFVSNELDRFWRKDFGYNSCADWSYSLQIYCEILFFRVKLVLTFMASLFQLLKFPLVLLGLFYLLRPNFSILRFGNIQCRNVENNMLIALVGLLNTNAITLFLSRLLKWPNFEQIRRWSFFLLELFSVFFSNLGKTLEQIWSNLRSYQTFYILGQFGLFTNRLKIVYKTFWDGTEIWLANSSDCSKIVSVQDVEVVKFERWKYFKFEWRSKKTLFTKSQSKYYWSCWIVNEYWILQ